jgi:hypothetical protein
VQLWHVAEDVNPREAWDLAQVLRTGGLPALVGAVGGFFFELVDQPKPSQKIGQAVTFALLGAILGVATHYWGWW